jgi:hypothetical protein
VSPVNRELVAGDCWVFGDGCAGSVEWRTYPQDDRTFAMCDAHWQRYGPDGPEGGPGGPVPIPNLSERLKELGEV